MEVNVWHFRTENGKTNQSDFLEQTKHIRGDVDSLIPFFHFGFKDFRKIKSFRLFSTNLFMGC